MTRCLDAKTMKYYTVTKVYSQNGALVERQTGRRYNLVKRYES